MYLDPVVTICDTPASAPLTMIQTEVTMSVKWDPQSVRQAVDMELNFPLSGDSAATPASAEALAKNKARSAVPVAMDSIIYLATYSENESLRLKAATYLVDQVLGRSDDRPMFNIVDDDDPLTRLVKAVTTHAN